MSHIWMRHVTHMNESCHAYEWVMSHIWMSHVTQVLLELSRMYEWVTSHIWMSHIASIWMSHVTHVNESWQIYGWVKSHLWMRDIMRHITYIGWIMSHMWTNRGKHTWMRQVTLMSASYRTWTLVYMRRTHSHVRHDTFRGVTSNLMKCNFKFHIFRSVTSNFSCFPTINRAYQNV